MRFLSEKYYLQKGGEANKKILVADEKTSHGLKFIDWQIVK
ncbi:hypothetical protein BMS3Abin05_00106 [bacterium BMS3Abin05]|nr:hypothetical protein BMS3Abin05_00106 [bacterium BMS3Abin05]GBE26890.1 hypothetical protein BMS3Bbin03_00810 [bacterium BMS3Bbin03]